MVFIVILRFDRDNRVVHGHLVVVHVDADGGALLLLLPIPGRHPVRGPGVRVHVEAGVLVRATLLLYMLTVPH